MAKMLVPPALASLCAVVVLRRRWGSAAQVSGKIVWVGVPNVTAMLVILMASTAVHQGVFCVDALVNDFLNSKVIWRILLVSSAAALCLELWSANGPRRLASHLVAGVTAISSGPVISLIVFILLSLVSTGS